MSNVLGTIPPVRLIADAAHAAGAVVVADGAELVPHAPVDVRVLGVDFLAFSAHKMMGPTGIGVLWGRADLLQAMPPFLGGGGMILDVKLDGFKAAPPPARLEAGTPPIAEAVGLTAAIAYLNDIGMDRIRAHEAALVKFRSGPARREAGLRRAPCSDLLPCPDRGGVLSIAYRDVHAHDLAQVLDQFGVCVRPGHHCAKPLMRRLGVQATARAPSSLFSDEHDIEVLIEGLLEAGKDRSANGRPRRASPPERSSSTTTAHLGTVASWTRPRPIGWRASTRCAATRSWCRWSSRTASWPTSRSEARAAPSASPPPR